MEFIFRIFFTVLRRKIVARKKWLKIDILMMKKKPFDIPYEQQQQQQLNLKSFYSERKKSIKHYHHRMNKSKKQKKMQSYRIQERCQEKSWKSFHSFISHSFIIFVPLNTKKHFWPIYDFFLCVEKRRTKFLNVYRFHV